MKKPNGNKKKNPARKNKEKETKLKSIVYKSLIVQVYKINYSLTC